MLTPSQARGEVLHGHYPLEFLQQLYEVGNIILLLLLRKLRFRGSSNFPKVTEQGQNRDLPPYVSDSRARLLTIIRYPCTGQTVLCAEYTDTHTCMHVHTQEGEINVVWSWGQGRDLVWLLEGRVGALASFCELQCG